MSNEFNGVFPSISRNEANELLWDERKRLGKEEFEKQLEDAGCFIGLLRRVRDMSTFQIEFLKEAFSHIDTTTSGQECTNDDDPEDTFTINNKTVKFDKKFKGTELSGKQARYMVLAKGKNIKRINLYNSGFYVVLRVPSLVEINLVYNQIEEDMNEYGRMFGTVFYMYSDFYIKEILWDFIYSLVLDSNLKDWNRADRLKRGVSFQDFNQLLLNVGALMFGTGYDMTYVCTNPKCKATKKVKLDLTKLQLTDFSKIPSDLLKTFHTAKAISLDGVLKYQRELASAYNTNTIVGGYQLNLLIPSMADYLEHGARFNEQLLMSIQDIKNEDFVDQYFMYNYSKLYLPWISSVANMEDGEILFNISDKTVFDTVLDEIQASEEVNDFRIYMNKFIQQTMITQIAHLSEKCPKCELEPSNAVEGFIPFDAQHHFFNLLVMRLVLTS